MKVKSYTRKGKRVKGYTRKGKRRKKNARYYGDNPRIRGGRDRATRSKRERWERKYKRKRRRR